MGITLAKADWPSATQVPEPIDIERWKDDRDFINGRLYEFSIHSLKELLETIPVTISERFKDWLWPEAIGWFASELLEILLLVWLIGIRKMKVGFECDMYGRYAYEFETGRPLYKLTY